MRPKVLRIRFWPLKDIAIYDPRCEPPPTLAKSPRPGIPVTVRNPARQARLCKPIWAGHVPAEAGRAQSYGADALMAETPIPGVRACSHPGSANLDVGAPLRN